MKFFFEGPMTERRYKTDDDRVHVSEIVMFIVLMLTTFIVPLIVAWSIGKL